MGKRGAVHGVRIQNYRLRINLVLYFGPIPCRCEERVLSFVEGERRGNLHSVILSDYEANLFGGVMRRIFQSKV